MVTRGDPYERELENRLWSEGWASFRVAGSGSVPHESADIVAVKNGICLIFEVKSVKEENLPEIVSGDSEQLMELFNRAKAGSGEKEHLELGKERSIGAFFAVKVKESDVWRFVEWYKTRLPQPSEMGKMYELLNRAE